MPIQVMIVDDSAVVRQVLSSLLNDAPDIVVSRVAADPLIAQRYLDMGQPDVMVLDVEMPRMDGITFLRKIMQERPMPVVICSSLAQKNCKLSLEALAIGAVDIVTKPQVGLKDFLLETKQEFWRVIRAAAQAKVRTMPVKAYSSPLTKEQDNLLQLSATTDRIVAVGTSTGGTQALEFICMQLARNCPGIAVVQHMPEKFTSAFAKRLNDVSDVEVREAESGDRLLPGRVLIAPGGHHLEIRRSGAQYMAHVFRGPAVNRHCPSVDVLFRSVAKHVGANATGIILTGMGDDGAQGLLAMRNSGASTIAQDEASSVVFGMPREAIKLDAAMRVASLQDIPRLIHQSGQLPGAGHVR